VEYFFFKEKKKKKKKKKVVLFPTYRENDWEAIVNALTPYLSSLF
jgi:hypothetical protein